MARKTAAEAPMKTAKQPTAEERGPTIEDRFAEFSARYKWYILGPVGVLIVIVIVLAIMSGRANAERRAATAALRTARTTADYETVAAEYPTTFSGRLALVRAGDQLFREGNSAEARAKYTAFLATRPDPLLAFPVRTSVVQTYIREKNYTAAITECDVLLGADGRQLAQHQAMYYRAYCCEQLGRLGEAKTWYEKVAPIPTTRADYAITERAWWQRGWQKLNEVNRQLESKPEELGGTESSVPSVTVTSSP